MKENKFIVYSKSEYTILKNLNNIKSGVDPLNISEIDTSILKDPREIIAKCETLPLLGTKRVIIIKADFLYDDYKDKLNIFKCLKKYIKDIPNFTTLVLYLYQRDKREKISKRIKELQKQGMTLITDSNDTLEKRKIVTQFIHENKINIDKEIINFIVTSSSNLDMLINDLDKLKFMKDISIDSIKKAFCSLDEDDLLDLLNEVAENNKATALKIVNVLLDSGSQPVQIVKSIAKQYQRLLYCKAGLMDNKSVDDIASEYKLHPYFCERLCNTAQKLKIVDIAYDLESCMNLSSKILNIAKLDTKSELEILIFKLK